MTVLIKNSNLIQKLVWVEDQYRPPPPPPPPDYGSGWVDHWLEGSGIDTSGQLHTSTVDSGGGSRPRGNPNTGDDDIYICVVVTTIGTFVVSGLGTWTLIDG